MEVKRQQRRKPMSEINVVPMIDVMLVLLIVFMVTTPLITQGIKVDLPKVNSETMEESDKPTLVVSVDAQGQYFISLGKESQDNPPPVPGEQIGMQVAKIMSANPGVQVYVQGDGSVNFAVVAELMGILAEAGVQGMSIITQPAGVGAK
jgi:biopolymer transport protein TolR